MVQQKTLPRRLDRAFLNLGTTSNALRDLLMLAGDPSHPAWFDHFIGDSAGTWPADANWGYPATAGTGTEVIALAGGIGGTLTLTTGANANDSAGQGVGLHWSGDTGFYFIARVKLDTITSSKIEIGMTDSVADDGGAVDTKATPTFTATDCVLFVRDTTEDTALTLVSNGGSADANVDADFTVAADTYFIVEIVAGGPSSTTGDFASGYINGQYVGGANISGAAALTPWFCVETLTTATRTMTVDYGACIGNL